MNRYLEIREAATGYVVKAIEILSPKNKREGEGRKAYKRKRKQASFSNYGDRTDERSSHNLGLKPITSNYILPPF